MAKVSSKLTLSRVIESDAHGTQGAGMDRVMAGTVRGIGNPSHVYRAKDESSSASYLSRCSLAEECRNGCAPRSDMLPR